MVNGLYGPGYIPGNDKINDKLKSICMLMTLKKRTEQD